MYLRSVIILLALSLCLSCSDEDFDDNLVAVNLESLIAQDSDLFGLMERMTTDDPDEINVTCIKFIYNFTLVTYDEDTELQASQIITSDEEFSAALASVQEGTYIGLSFPITSQLEDGSTFVINDKDELKAAIDACIEEEQEEAIGNCEGLLLECVWEVQLPEDATGYDTFENAVFDVASDGTVAFYHRGVRYNGTWIVYFIEYELHININLDDSGTIGEQWNFDWKTVILSDLAMDIQTDDGKHYILTQECDEDEYCTTLLFSECELGDAPGTAQFELQNYLECIEIMVAPEPEQGVQQDYTYSFYLTEEDANTSTSAIDITTPFVTSATSLFVRIEEEMSSTFTVVEVLLVVEDCIE